MFGIRIVRENERVMLFRLGRAAGIRAGVRRTAQIGVRVSTVGIRAWARTLHARYHANVEAGLQWHARVENRVGPLGYPRGVLNGRVEQAAGIELLLD